MKSENINSLIEFWKEFENQATFTIKDMKKLSDKMGHAMESIRQLEESRDGWRAKYEIRNDDAKDYAKEITRLKKVIKWKD